ncbi:MAG: S1C family serine protease [Nocardioidaceae bacterium]
MSEPDEPAPPTGEQQPPEPGDTQPVRPEPGPGPQYPPPAPSPYASPPAPAEPEPTASYPIQPYPTQPPAYAASQPSLSVPRWLWPAVAAMALVIGVVGGTIGGVAVSTTMDHNTTVPVVGTDNTVPPPLSTKNVSVAAVAARLLPSTVQVQANGGANGDRQGGATGSGFVFDRHGHIITNNHVVAGATGSGELKVVDADGRSHSATIVGRSPVYDVAVLKVAGAEKLRPASLGSSHSMRVGDTVVAIGSPLGLSSTVTSGIISALDRPVTTGDQNQSSFIDAVQTDAAINPGNSGGPLVNMRGQVVGVNSAIATVGASQGAESGSIGVGFAIPMEQVRITAAQILATGQARYPVIGADVNTGESSNGARVVSVPSGTPASRAGLREGDVIVDVDSKPVIDGIGLIVAIRTHQPGETVTLTIKREGQRETIRVTLNSKVG